jgi:hypothetical protein
MTTSGEVRDYSTMNRSGEAVGGSMGIDDVNSHFPKLTLKPTL